MLTGLSAACYPSISILHGAMRQAAPAALLLAAAAVAIIVAPAPLVAPL